MPDVVRRTNADASVPRAELEHTVRDGVGWPALRLTSPADVSFGLFVHLGRGRSEPLCAAPPGAQKKNARRNGRAVRSYSTDKATLEQVLRANAASPHIVAVVSAVLEHRSLQDLVRCARGGVLLPALTVWYG